MLSPTIVYVSHDEREIFEIADHVIVLQEGVVLQEGTNIVIENYPNSGKVAEIIGGWNVINALANMKDSNLIVSTDIFEFSLTNTLNSLPKEIKLGVAASEIHISKRCPSSNTANIIILKGEIERMITTGNFKVAKVNINNSFLNVTIPPFSSEYLRGDQIFLKLEIERIRLWKN